MSKIPLSPANTLTPKQRRFADEYLIDFNCTRAYKVAYNNSNDNSSAASGLKLLRNPKVEAYLSARKEKLANKLQITQEMVLEGYRRLAFYDVRKFYRENGDLKHVTELDEATAFALAGFEVAEEKTTTSKRKTTVTATKKIKMSDRRAALDSICKVLGFNAPDKTELSGKVINYNSEPLSPDKIKEINEALENEY